jgi:hypothetical protein
MRRSIFTLICLLTFVLLGIVPATVSTQSLDQMLVVDDAKIFGDRVVEVEAAANRLKAQGADVRVRTIPSYGAAGNLDQYESQLEQESPSWLDQNGSRKNNLIVLIISLQERQTGLYYGAYWEDVLGQKWLSIQTDVMNPLFRNGDYAGGAIEGLDEIERLIAGNGQSESKWWLVPVVIVAIIGSIVGIFLFKSSRKKRARLNAARQKAMLPKQAAASGINELIEAVQMLEIKVNVMADRLTADEASPLQTGLEKAKGLINQSSQRYSELSHSAGDPENPRLEESQLTVIETEYQKIVDTLRQARESVKAVEEEISGIQAAVDAFPGKVAELNAAIAAALTKEDDLNRTGYKTKYPAELVARGRTTLEQAQDLVSKKRIGEGMKYLGLAGDQIKQAVKVLEELPSKKTEAEAAIPALAQRIEQIKESISSGRAVFERLSHDYAPTTWESVRGNGTEAENRVNWALDVLDDARAAAASEEQEWHKALELVEQGNTWLTECESLMKSISDLELNLIAARRDAPDEINAAQADVAKAWAYINQYDEDIRESLEDDLRAAEKKNELAKEELRQAKPDYFKVCKLARESNEAADRILIQARDEHEAAERLRAKAVSTRRDASAKVSIARSYIEVHQPVVRAEARNYLSNAVQALRQAETAIDSNSQISLALKAESDADQAYSLAQRDVNGLTGNIHGIGIPTTIPIPTTTGHSPGGGFYWGSRRSSSSGSGTIRRGGGSSSSWGSRGGSIGGGGSRGGGGSTGW